MEAPLFPSRKTLLFKRCPSAFFGQMLVGKFGYQLLFLTNEAPFLDPRFELETAREVEMGNSYLVRLCSGLWWVRTAHAGIRQVKNECHWKLMSTSIFHPTFALRVCQKRHAGSKIFQYIFLQDFSIWL